MNLEMEFRLGQKIKRNTRITHTNAPQHNVLSKLKHPIFVAIDNLEVDDLQLVR